MALMHLTVVPLGTGSPSLSEYVVEIQRAMEQEGVRFQLTDMGTVVEGAAAELLALAAKMHALPFAHGAQRVMTQITLDERRDKVVALGDKVAAVQAKR